MKSLVIAAVLVLLLVLSLASIGESDTSDPCVEAPLTECDIVQRAVSKAMAELQLYSVNPLTPGFITNAINSVGYNNGSTPLPIGDYITGGLESLEYAYHVSSDGGVTALTRPDH